tara:strand:- start:118 stop:342 length:225 start_codon:yes stop_codon:yes gene_type:complete
MIYDINRQENGTCNSCGYTSWKYEDASLPYKEEICLNSLCRYATRNGRSEIMNKTDWTKFLSSKAEPHLTLKIV